MKISFALACDYTIVAKDEKLSLIGLFNRVFSDTEPTATIPFFVAVGLALEHEDLGRSTSVSIRLIGPEAEVLSGADAMFSIDAKADLEGGLNLVFPFDIAFPKFGPYVVQVTVGKGDPYQINLLATKR